MPTRFQFLRCLFTLAAGTAILRAQEPPAILPPGTILPYDGPVTLLAEDIFPPSVLKGSNYTVRSEVPSEGGINRFTIDSDEGVFTADGNAMLIERLKEIEAITRLRQVSKKEEYKAALKTAATAPLDLAKGLVNRPGETVKSVGRGAWKMMTRVSDGIRGAVEGRAPSSYAESNTREWIGFSEVKRGLAIDMGVDPYSRNEVLNKVLDEVAWTSYAGKMTFSAALLPLGGNAANLASGFQMGSSLQDSLKVNGPGDLRVQNSTALTGLGISPALVESFLSNPAFSPLHQTVFTHSLTRLRKTEGPEVLVELTQSAEDEEDARFFQHTSQMLARLHESGTPIARIVSLQGFPVCLAKDGSVVVALALDYATWGEVTDKFTQALLKPQNITPTGFRLVLTGSVSPNMRQVLATRNIQLTEKFSANTRQ